ncbi:MAG TPA: VOC family protein [Terracidiphilus sp.]|nr:VOC family protein [Terracidiphilus sp.]
MRFRGQILSLIAVSAFLCPASLIRAQGPAPVRPAITGISHVGYFVTDLNKTVAFWHDLLGFDEYFHIDKTGTTQMRIAFIKINDRQHVELFTDPSPDPPNMMSHICFTVSNVEQMRAYLRSKGFNVKPGNGKTTKAGDYAFEIKDPDGTLVEFVQSLPTGVEARDKGKFLPPTRISPAIYHAGFMVGNAEKSMAFYEGVLGFKEFWRGGKKPGVLNWIDLRVPNGQDYIELMLYTKPPKSYGTENHVSLVVPSMQKAVAELQGRPYAKTYLATYGKPLEVHVGVNGKRQVNLYDPDGTRVELMEPFTASGKPVPPSTAPLPPPTHQ